MIGVKFHPSMHGYPVTGEGYLPAVDYPVIQVSVGYPGASPETVAANIATPLERQFMQVPGLELITSRSTQGYCNLVLQFALSKGLDEAATDVQAAITQATRNLPVDLPSPPTFRKTNPDDQPILYLAVASDSLTRGQVYDLASTQVAQRISILSGVRYSASTSRIAAASCARSRSVPASITSGETSPSRVSNTACAHGPILSASLPGR